MGGGSENITMNKSCPKEVPSISKIVIDISSTKVNDFVNNKVTSTNEICRTEIHPITNIQDNLFPANKLKSAIINKNLVQNKKRCIIDLLNITEVLTNKKSLTTQEYNSKWRSTCNLLKNITYTAEPISNPYSPPCAPLAPFQPREPVKKIWHIEPNEIQLTEQYMAQATVMIDNDQPNTFMPDCNNRFTHFPSDVLSLQNRTCLTGTIMDTFLYCMTINVADGSSNDTMNVFNTSF